MARNALETRKLKIRHFSHRDDLLFEYDSIYTCNGCGEVGHGFRYRCRPCNFDMHESCARAPEFTSHVIGLPDEHHLVFKKKPDLAHVVCDVCGEKIEGFVYECRGRNIDLHPSCARLPHSLPHALHPHHTLLLEPSQSTPFLCNVCGRGFTQTPYCYRCCDFILHISCAKLPVDPLEEMRMQSILEEMRMLSISPLEVPCGHMFTGAPSGTAAAAQVRSSSSTVRAAQVISTSSTGAASSSSTGAATQAISAWDVLRAGSAVLDFTSSVLEWVDLLSNNN